MTREIFHWDDPLLLDAQLTAEEKMLRDARATMRRGSCNREC